MLSGATISTPQHEQSPIFYQDPRDRALLYETSRSADILPFLRSASIRGNFLAVKPDLYNLQVLRHFGLPVIPPINDNYDWPIKKGFRARDHQKVMTNFMVLHPRSFNLSDMGTMKTLAILWACDFLMQQNPGTKALIVAPLSILQRVWGDAIFQHFVGRRTYTIVHGPAAKRRELLKRNTDFYIINHDGMGIGARKTKRGEIELDGLSKDIAERTDISIVAIDEASAYRDGSTLRSRVARKVLQGKPYIWPLTGSPTSNGPLDAHGLARLIDRTDGESFDAYKKRVMYRLSQWVWKPRPGAEAEAKKLLQPAIRFEMRECTDVPPCTVQMRDVDLSPEQKKLYANLKRDATLQLEKGTINAVNEAALRLKLIQLSCGAIYDGNHVAHRVDCAPRLAVLREVIEEAARKVLIFSPLTSIVNLLFTELKEYSRAMVNGQVPLKARNVIFDRFQNDADPRILILDPACASHGLDLFAANVVVWYGATDRTELYLQANRRIDRPGQTVGTTIVQLAATPVEREIYKRLDENQSVQGVILKMIRDS